MLRLGMRLHETALVCCARRQWASSEARDWVGGTQKTEAARDDAEATARTRRLRCFWMPLERSLCVSERRECAPACTNSIRRDVNPTSLHNACILVVAMSTPCGLGAAALSPERGFCFATPPGGAWAALKHTSGPAMSERPGIRHTQWLCKGRWGSCARPRPRRGLCPASAEWHRGGLRLARGSAR